MTKRKLLAATWADNAFPSRDFGRIDIAAATSETGQFAGIRNVVCKNEYLGEV